MTENAVADGEDKGTGGKPYVDAHAETTLEPSALPDRQKKLDSGDEEERLRSQTDRTETATSGDGRERPAPLSGEGVGAGRLGDGEDGEEEKVRLMEDAVYDDTDVCRVLGIRRRILVQHRTAASRGKDWECAGEHAGMKEGWIRRWNAKADIESMKPIEEGDGITTVKVAGHVPNRETVLAVKVSDGARVIARVPDAQLLHRGDEMDCRMQGGMLTYAPELNRERY